MSFRFISIIGILAAILFIGTLVFFMETHVSTLLWNPLGLALVIGGSLIATVLSHQNTGLSQLRHAIKGFFMNDADTQEAARVFLKLAKEIHGKNPQEIEEKIHHIRIPFLRAGLQLLADNARTEDIMKVLSFRINRARDMQRLEANLFYSMAIYAPAFGMLGTLLGLLGMLSGLGSGDLSQIGMQMALALVTTFYGIILANLVFRPVAIQLERRAEQQVYILRVLAEAIILLHLGRSVTEVREILSDITRFSEDELSEA